MRLKILHILHSLQIGGLENGVVNLINHLDHDRFEHSICCIKSSGPMAQRITRRDIQIIELKKKGRDYFLPLKLMNLIRRINPDIVHTRNWSAIDGVIGAKLAGVVHIIHGEHGREANDPTGKNQVRKKVRRLLNPWISRFVTVSAELRNWLVHDVGVPDWKVVQIINGVDTNRFCPPQDKAAAKTKAGLPPDSFVIGSVGRLDSVKDYTTLIRAFASVLNGQTGLTGLTGKTVLMIIGSGPEERKLKLLAEELGVADKTVFLGERIDIPELLQSIDVFVLPSIAEGISNTILEAMACGLPVIATNVGGNPELIQDNHSGFLFIPGDHKGLANALFFYCLNNSVLREHGIQGRKRAEERLSLSAMVKKYEELYELLPGSLACSGRFFKK
jgi:sugar transferase (PEP-CTERM/EpsH1 system associated)